MVSGPGAETFGFRLSFFLASQVRYKTRLKNTTPAQCVSPNKQHATLVPSLLASRSYILVPLEVNSPCASQFGTSVHRATAVAPATARLIITVHAVKAPYQPCAKQRPIVYLNPTDRSKGRIRNPHRGWPAARTVQAARRETSQS